MKLKNSTILITGASGFIGSHLVNKLTKEGAYVVGISRTRRESKQNLIWKTGNLTNKSFVSKLITYTKPDAIIHLASKVTGDRSIDQVLPIFEDNLVSTVNILTEASKQKVKRVVLTGSMEEPDSKDSVIVSPYAAAKWAQKGYAEMFSKLYGLHIIYLKLFMVYGPGQRDEKKVIPYTIRSIQKEINPKYSSGKRMVDWIYIDDVVQAFVKALHVKTDMLQSFDIGTRKMTSVKDVAHKISLIMKYKRKIEFGGMKERKFDKVTFAKTEKAKEVLGFEAKMNLTDGLKKTIDWYKKN